MSWKNEEETEQLEPHYVTTNLDVDLAHHYSIPVEITANSHHW